MMTRRDMLTELVPAVPPISMEAIVSLGSNVLRTLAPEMLESPQPLDVESLIDHRLAKVGIFVSEGRYGEMGACHGLTYPSAQGVEILLDPDTWGEVFGHGPASRMPRATFAHELAHAVLHATMLRRAMARTTPVLARRRENLRAFEDPEWQAWALAGQLLAPREMLLQFQGSQVEAIAGHFEISSSMLRSHLRRLRIERRFA